MSFLVVPLFILTLSACSKDSPTGNGNPTLAEKLQATLDDERSNRELIGASAAVIIDLETWLGVSGMSDPQTSRPIELQMLFGIGSITKTYSATLILQLVEDGLMNLADPISRWLPDFAHVDSTITLRQLLNHTSGVFNYTDNPFFFENILAEPGNRVEPETILGYLDPPEFAPGSSWAYSNTNYILLGMIIEASTNATVTSEMSGRILQTLNLNSTYLSPDLITTGTIAHNWSSFLNQKGNLEDLSSLPKTALYSAAWTAGSIIATAEETARFAHALLTGGILDQATLAEMLTFTPVGQSPWSGYGLGVQQITALNRELWGHGGSIPGFSSFVLHSGVDKITVAVLINQDAEEHGLEIALELLATALNN